MPDFAYEISWRSRSSGPVAGVDEAGRGPLAGPVVAAAAILDPDRAPADLVAALDDSKVLCRQIREELYPQILEHASVRIGVAQVVEIDTINILQAAMLAMRRAVDALPERPAAILVDGNRMPGTHYAGEAVVCGDAICCSIAAASIIAKVARDRMMTAFSTRHMGYGWERNAGYGTPEHHRALRQLGVTSLHRRSFKPIRNLLNQEDC